MKRRLPEILLVSGTAIIFLGYLAAPGIALPRLIGFLVLAAGFYAWKRR